MRGEPAGFANASCRSCVVRRIARRPRPGRTVANGGVWGKWTSTMSPSFLVRGLRRVGGLKDKIFGHAHQISAILRGSVEQLTCSPPAAVGLVDLQIAQGGIQDRRREAAPCRTPDQVANGVLALCRPTILHVDQQGWSIG